MTAPTKSRFSETFPGMFKADRGNQFWLDHGLRRAGMQEVCMANWMIIRFAALAAVSMALVVAPAFAPAFAAGGGGGGIGAGGESPPAASGTKATKAKKTSKQQSS